MDTFHAHVSTRSADCDGIYDRDYVMRPEGEQDRYGFRIGVLGHVVSFHATASLDMRENRFTYHEATEEGFRAAEVEFCDRDCSDKERYRDHSAEAAGY